MLVVRVRCAVLLWGMMWWVIHTGGDACVAQVGPSHSLTENLNKTIYETVETPETVETVETVETLNCLATKLFHENVPPATPATLVTLHPSLPHISNMYEQGNHIRRMMNALSPAGSLPAPLRSPLLQVRIRSQSTSPLIPYSREHLRQVQQKRQVRQVRQVRQTHFASAWNI